MNGQGTLRIGHGGWVRFEPWSDPALVLYARAVERRGRLAIGEVYIHRTDGEPLDADEHQVPRQRLLSTLNAPQNARAVRRWINDPGPDLSRAAAFYATQFFVQQERSTGELRFTGHWAARMLLAQEKGSGIKQAPWPRTVPPEAQELPEPEEIDAKLDIPTTKRFPSEFYRQVRRLADEIGEGNAPAKVIAEANGVPHARVRQWITTARRRANGR